MKKYFYLFLLPLCLGLGACGGDSDDGVSKPEPVPEPEPEKEMEINSENLAKYVKASITYNSSKWLYTANIQTSLMSSPLTEKVSDKEVKYGMRVWYDTSYTEDGYKDIEVSFSDTQTGGFILYANGGGTTYQVSVYTPFYYSTQGYNKSKGKKEKLDEPDPNPAAELLDYQITIAYLKTLIDQGKATKADIETYNELIGRVAEIRNTTVKFTNNLYHYCEAVAEVFLEIDGKMYVIAKKKGPVRIPTYGDIYDNM